MGFKLAKQGAQISIIQQGASEKKKSLELTGIGADGCHGQALAMALEQDLPRKGLWQVTEKYTEVNP